MYESFYGLREKPFTLLPDPEYLYLSPKHQRALTLLEYGMMNQAGFSVICGDTGAGKTTLIRRLLTELGDDTTVGLITNTHQSFGELLNWVLMAFGLDGENKTKAQMHQMFIEFLIEQYARNKHTVLIVDEAQNMSAETLEELRMLSNINADKDQVLQVVLSGQPALRETLRKPELMQFAQRIAVDYYLESLSAEETHSYIQHRLKIAGADQEIFSREACNTVYKYSGGTPRLINLLCDTSLVYGFAEQTKSIAASLVEDVVREQHSNSIVPTFNMPVSEQTETDLEQQVKTTAPQVVTESVEEPRQDIANEEQEAVIAELGQRAKQAVSNMDSTARTATSQVESISVGQAEESSQATVETTPSEPIKAESPEEINKESKVTPINQDVSLEELVKDEELNQEHEPQPAQANTEEKQEAFEEQIVIEETVAPVDTETKNHRKHKPEYEDVYPIIQVEDNSKKNINLLILGIAGGMFVATIVMLVVGYMMFSNTAPQIQQEVYNQPKSINSPLDIQRQQEIETARMEALQKERDAALAITKALERERDAALAAAKAQEEMRAAEKRAAELIADQERRTAQEVRRAKEKARLAEIAAVKAKERERLAKEQAQLAKAEAEKVKTEKARQQQVATMIQPSVEQAVVVEPVITKPETKAVAKQVEPLAKNKPQQPVKFSTNPCNSPSAKFLSTCKK